LENFHKNAFPLVLLCALAPATLALAAPDAAAPAAKSAEAPISVMALAGYESLSGAGLRVTLSDGGPINPRLKADSFTPGLVHDYDLLALVNELRGQGARGIAVGGVRLTNQSAIRAVGPTILVDRQALKAPFVVEAVGNGALIKSYLELKQGVMEQMRQTGIKSKVEALPIVTLKAAPLPIGVAAK